MIRINLSGTPEWIRTTDLLLRRHCGQAHLIDSTDRRATVQSHFRLQAGEIAGEIAGEVPQWFLNVLGYHGADCPGVHAKPVQNDHPTIPVSNQKQRDLTFGFDAGSAQESQQRPLRAEILGISGTCVKSP